MTRHEGFVDHLENGWLLGWAWRSDRPRDPICVDLLLDGRFVSSTLAGRYRSDLEGGGIGDGRHAFEIELPAEFRDGAEHEIAVRFSGSARELVGSPLRARFGSEPAGAPLSAIAPNAAAGAPFRSPFGGIWTDRIDALERIAAKSFAGEISEREAEQLRSWVRDGYVVFPQAVPHAWIDELDRDVEAVWEGRSSARCFVEYFEDGQQLIVPAGPANRNRPCKLLDVYDRLESARRVIFAPAIERFLSILFEEPAVAFQGLYFRFGSRQAIHQDSAFVKVSPPLAFAASWVALEDIVPGSGELEYFVGSHRLDDYLFQGKYKWMPLKSPEYQEFIDSLRRRSEADGLELKRFLAQKGDVLLWSADLAHGGSPNVKPGLTRKSLVTHYCPHGAEPVYGPGTRKPPRERYSALSFFTRAPRE